MSPYINPLSTKLNNLDFHPLEVVARYRDPQLQVFEITHICLICDQITHLKLCLATATHNFKCLKITHICLI